MYSLFRLVLEALTDIVYPRGLKCIKCSDESEINDLGLCPKCYLSIYKLDRKCNKCGSFLESHYAYDVCLDCRNFERYFDNGYVAYTYEGVIKDLIINYKYNKKSFLYYYFSKMLENIDDLEFKSYDFITVVPSSKERLRERGYDHIHLIGKEISKNTGVKYIRDFIVKDFDTLPQNQLSREERLVNIEGVFRVNNKYDDFEFKRMLVIDDIFTTGATINEVSKSIKLKKNVTVDFVTLASGV